MSGHSHWKYSIFLANEKLLTILSFYTPPSWNPLHRCQKSLHGFTQLTVGPITVYRQVKINPLPVVQFANSLDPDQAPQNVRPDFDIMIFLKEHLEMVHFEKRQQNQTCSTHHLLQDMA